MRRRDVTLPVKIDYARRHDLGVVSRTHTYQHSYERQDFMLEALPSADWVWFTGADVLITNHTIDVRTLLTPDTDLIITDDVMGVNNDSMLVRNCAACTDLILRIRSLMQQGVANDQMALAQCWNVVPDLRIKIVPQRAMNSYDYTLYPYHRNDVGSISRLSGSWQPGDLVLHVPALPVRAGLQF